MKGAKDAPPPRPSKRPRLGPSPMEAAAEAGPSRASHSNAKAKVEKVGKGKTGKDSQMEEFLQVMKPRTKKGPSWADNDALQPDSSRAHTSMGEAGDAPTAEASKKKTEKKQETQHDAIAAEGKEKVAEPDTAEPVSDMDWFKQRTKAVLDESELTAERVFEQTDDEAEEDSSDDAKAGIDLVSTSRAHS